MSHPSPQADFRAVVSLFWRAKFRLLAFVAVGGLVATVLAIRSPDVYTSEVLVMPVESTSGTPQNLGLISSLGAIAGVNLQSSASQMELAIALIESRDFLVRFTAKHDIAPELIAAQSWDEVSGALRYDSAMYAEQNNQWLATFAAGKVGPTDSAVYDAFRNILRVQRDPNTGFATVSVSHLSPDLANTWARLLVAETNAVMRQKATEELDRSIEYLNKQMEGTNIAELKSSFAELLQAQIRDRMLADARSEYAMQTVDPAFRPDEPSGPPRKLMVLAGLILGGGLGVLAVLFAAVGLNHSSGAERSEKDGNKDLG